MESSILLSNSDHFHDMMGSFLRIGINLIRGLLHSLDVLYVNKCMPEATLPLRHLRLPSSLQLQYR